MTKNIEDVCAEAAWAVDKILPKGWYAAVVVFSDKHVQVSTNISDIDTVGDLVDLLQGCKFEEGSSKLILPS